MPTQSGHGRHSPQEWENIACRTGQKVAAAQPVIESAYYGLIALFPAGGAASIGARGTRTVAATDGSFTLYRAVGQREFAALAGTGEFTAGAGSLGGKWFATTADDAATWGSRMFGDEPFRIVSATFPVRRLVNMIRKTGRYDGIGPAVYAELDQLVGAIVEVVR